jgi:predicted nucleic acid-binding protein
MPCVVDTSAFYAYMVSGDRFHEVVKEYLSSAVRAGEVLRSTSLVLGETLGLLQTRHGFAAAARFMDAVYPIIEWRWVDDSLFDEAWRVAATRNARSFTIVDASVVACIREHPGTVCVAVDDDLAAFEFAVEP